MKGLAPQVMWYEMDFQWFDTMHHSESQDERRGLNYINLITQDSLVGMKVSTISLIAYEDIRITIIQLHLSDVYNSLTDT